MMMNNTQHAVDSTKKLRYSDKLRDQDTPNVLGYEQLPLFQTDAIAQRAQKIKEQLLRRADEDEPLD